MLFVSDSELPLLCRINCLNQWISFSRHMLCYVNIIVCFRSTIWWPSFRNFISFRLIRPPYCMGADTYLIFPPFWTRRSLSLVSSEVVLLPCRRRSFRGQVKGQCEVQGPPRSYIPSEVILPVPSVYQRSAKVTKSLLWSQRSQRSQRPQRSQRSQRSQNL